jgi:hypothetical protein
VKLGGIDAVVPSKIVSFASLPALPIELECRSNVLNMPEAPYSVVQPYVLGSPFPTFPDGLPPGSPSERVLAPVKSDGLPGSVSWAVIEALRPGSPRPLTVIDLAGLPAVQWNSALTRFLPRVRGSS